MFPVRNVHPELAVSHMCARHARKLLAAVAPALLVAACAGVPTQEMSDARQAISAARGADAASIAPRSMDSAERLLSDAKSSLRAGEYDIARNDAMAARRAAMLAREVAVVIADTRVALAEAKSRGIDSRVSEQLLDEAEAAARRGEEGRAMALATQARQRLE